MVRTLRKLDDLVFKVEAGLCLVLIGAMTVAVFLDVVHRQAASAGRLHAIVGALLPASMVTPVVTAIALGGVAGVFFLGLRGSGKIGGARAAVWALVASAVAFVGVRVLLALAPNGLIWSQRFALSAMLWVGFLGASMATKHGAHLTLEITDFIWRGRSKPLVDRVGSVLGAAFCAVLALLTAMQVRLEYQEWVESDGMGGVFEGFAAPRFAIFVILPLSFSMMTVRFLGRAVAPPPQEEPRLTAPPVEAGAEGAR